MTIRHRSIVVLLLPMLAAGTSPGLRTTMAEAQAPAARLVPLTAGTCAQVTDGDVLTLEWNPGFEMPSVVSGLRDFSLSFARNEELATLGRRGPSLHLEAAPPSIRGAALDQAITPIGNGFFQIHFQVRTEGLSSGTYNLVAAQAMPSVTAEYQGEAPRMLNSPTRYPFCLVVTGTTGIGPNHRQVPQQ